MVKVGNGGYVETVADEEEDTVVAEVTVACAGEERGEETALAGCVDNTGEADIAPNTGTCTGPSPFPVVLPAGTPMGISIDSDEDEAFLFFFPLEPTPPPPLTFASLNSLSSCFLFNAYKLDSNDIALDDINADDVNEEEVAGVVIGEDGCEEEGVMEDPATANEGEVLFHNGPSLLASAANLFAFSAFSRHMNHSSGGSRSVLRLRKKTKECTC